MDPASTGSGAELTVEPDAAGMRLDTWLADHVAILSRSQAKRAIDDGDVLVAGEPGKPAQKLKAGQQVTVRLPEPEPVAIAAEPIPLDIVYEDRDLVVINKPAGMVTHPAPGATHGTLVNALLAHCDDLSGIGGKLRPGIVHRLDKDTSGLIVAAKHDLAHRHLAEQLAARTMHRRYLAIAYGEPLWDEMTVDAPIGRHHHDRARMTVTDDGRPARTHLRVTERFGLAALLTADLESGRTHQVRVHCTWLGHPLMGDRTYGSKKVKAIGPLPEPVAAAVAAMPGQALHAGWLTFRHPRDEQEMSFQAPPPEAFAALLEALRGQLGARR